MTLSDKRIGRFTASSIHRLMPGPKGGTKERDTYIFEKAEEIVRGHAKEFSNKYTEHGHLNEFEAIQTFAQVSGLEVRYLNQEFFLVNDDLGATPDADVIDFSEKRLASLDVKCPPEKFFKQKMMLINGAKPEYQNVIKDYFYQGQVQMMALGVEEHILVWYLTSMDVDMDGNKIEYDLPIESRLFYKKIIADKNVQKMILDEVERAAKERDLLVEILKKPII